MLCHSTRALVGLTIATLCATGLQTLGAEKLPVNVFILSGQSNMEGKAAASTLEPVIAHAATRDGRIDGTSNA